MDQNSRNSSGSLDLVEIDETAISTDVSFDSLSVARLICKFPGDTARLQNEYCSARTNKADARSPLRQAKCLEIKTLHQKSESKGPFPPFGQSILDALTDPVALLDTAAPSSLSIRHGWSSEALTRLVEPHERRELPEGLRSGPRAVMLPAPERCRRIRSSCRPGHLLVGVPMSLAHPNSAGSSFAPLASKK